MVVSGHGPLGNFNPLQGQGSSEHALCELAQTILIAPAGQQQVNHRAGQRVWPHQTSACV